MLSSKKRAVRDIHVLSLSLHYARGLRGVSSQAWCSASFASLHARFASCFSRLCSCICLYSYAQYALFAALRAAAARRFLRMAAARRFLRMAAKNFPMISQKVDERLRKGWAWFEHITYSHTYTCIHMHTHTPHHTHIYIYFIVGCWPPG
jgi:hypothetical protein